MSLVSQSPQYLLENSDLPLLQVLGIWFQTQWINSFLPILPKMISRRLYVYRCPDEHFLPSHLVTVRKNSVTAFSQTKLRAWWINIPVDCINITAFASLRYLWHLQWFSIPRNGEDYKQQGLSSASDIHNYLTHAFPEGFILRESTHDAWELCISCANLIRGSLHGWSVHLNYISTTAKQ